MCVICVCVFELGLLCGLLNLQMVCFVCLPISLMVWWLLLLLLIIPHREHCINITYTHCSTLYLLLRLIFYTSYISSYSFRILWKILKIIGCNLKHTPRLTHTHTERKKCSSFLLRLSLNKYFLCECQKTVKQMRTNDFLLKAKKESGSLRITAPPLLNYPRSATHRLPNNYSLCGCGCSRICYTKCTKYRKVNLCLNVFLDFLKIREGGQRTKELSLILSTNA